MKRCLGLLLTALVFWMPSAAAEQHGEQMVLEHLFPPELVMQHQRAIDLQGEQRTAITDAVKETQGKVFELQWSIHDEMQKLVELIQQPTVDEAAAVAQSEQLMQLEHQLKTTHLRLLIRIKNALTPDQQAKLKTLRRDVPPHPRPAAPRPPAPPHPPAPPPQ